MVIKSPIITEKVTSMIDTENTMVFSVDIRATKPEIKRAIEETYDLEVEKVKTMITPRGEKKAVAKLAESYNANELATRLGLL